MPDLLETEIEALARRLDRATWDAAPIPQVSHDADLTLDEAYAVQAAGVRLREERGDAVVGMKLGFTSKAKALQMGVADVIAGVLHQSMRVADGGTADVAGMVHPRIEPEVAFRLGAPIDPCDESSDIVAATIEVASALEIIDSRYRDFQFSLTDVVADNTSASAFVIGPWLSFDRARDELDLADLDVSLSVDGKPAARGSSADILGDPVLALSAIKRMAGRHGFSLPAGTVILAGAATAAVPLRAGAAVEATISGLGTVSVTAGRGRDD